MARSAQISVGPGAAVLLADKTLGGGLSVTVLNAHATELLYVGGDENQLTVGGGTALSAASGFRVAAGKALSVVLDGNEALYGICGTSTVTLTCHVFRSTHLSSQAFG